MSGKQNRPFAFLSGFRRSFRRRRQLGDCPLERHLVERKSTSHQRKDPGGAAGKPKRVVRSTEPERLQSCCGGSVTLGMPCAMARIDATLRDHPLRTPSDVGKQPRVLRPAP
eukprot:8335461-Pyramimonas_sp.AAC.1